MTMDKVFLAACRGEPTPYTPIWLNRQAGRYMPEYHQVKGDLPSLDFFKNPEILVVAPGSTGEAIVDGGHLGAETTDPDRALRDHTVLAQRL